MSFATTTASDQAQTELPRRRLGTETKSSTKTSELVVYVATVIAIAISAFLVGADPTTGEDPFSALAALQLITIVSVGYLLARGLAKSGSREGDDA